MEPRSMRLDGRPVVTVFLYALLYKSSSVRVAGALLLCLHGRQMNIYCFSCCAKCTAPGDGTVYGAPLLGLHGSNIVTKHPPSP